jgi:hypothetical protein
VRDGELEETAEAGGRQQRLLFGGAELDEPLGSQLRYAVAVVLPILAVKSGQLAVDELNDAGL